MSLHHGSYDVCTVGLGYIGLPTASLLATRGLSVLGVDVNEAVVQMICRGEIHIAEPDLDVLVKSAVQSGHLKAALEPSAADVFILAVPTPFRGDHEPDLAYVEAAVEAIAPHVQAGNLVILESTVPVGTTESVAGWLRVSRPDLCIAPDPGIRESSAAVGVAHCPERVLPGHILKELVENDRIIGGIDHASAVRAAEFYRSFVTGHVYLTDSRTAELAKLTENAFRDVNIAFANELSMICERMGIDVWELIELSNHHPRVNILRPGPGVGGHCIAVDPWFIIGSAPQEARLIRTARTVNLSKQRYIVQRILAAAQGLAEPVITCLGLAYKADVDDLRESPALEIVGDLADGEIGSLLVVEPHLEALPGRLQGLAGVELVDLDTAIERAQVCVLLVDHREFHAIDRAKLAGKAIIDTRGLWREPGLRWSVL